MIISVKNIILKGVIFNLLLFTFSFAFAQDRECDVYISNNPIGSGISVRWIGQKIIYQEGVTIFRKENNDWVKITSTPIMPAKSLPANIKLSDKAVKMFDIYLSQSADEFANGFGGIFTVIESVKEYNLALALHIAYNDETAVIGKDYQYKIETKIKGKTVVLGITDEINCQKFTPVSFPDSITVVRKKKAININWKNDINKYYSYDVYQRVEDGDWVAITDRLASTAIQKSKKAIIRIKASPDTAYSYQICGYDYFGQRSQMSKPFVLQPKDFTPPAIPKVRIDVDSKKMSVRISWSKNQDDDLSHYNIYRSIDPDNFSDARLNKENIPKTDTTYIDYPDRAGSYYYLIEAVDLAGNVSKSIFVNGTVYDIRPPVAPKNLIAKVDTGKLYLNWDANIDADLKGYRLYRSVADEDNSDNKYVVVSSNIIDTNFYMEPMSKNVRSKFVYIVRALDSSYNVSEPSNEVLAQLPDVTPPVAPFIKKTYEENNALKIEWMPNVEKDLMSYNLFKRLKGDTSDFTKLNIFPIPKKITSYTDVDAVRGQFYEYYLQAVDQSNLVSEKSNIALGKLEFIPLSGKILITKNKISKLKQELLIAWSTDSLINEPIIGSSVYKSVKGKKAIQMGSISNKLIYKEKLKESGTYQYHIRVYGSRGSIIKSDTINVEYVKPE